MFFLFFLLLSLLEIVLLVKVGHFIGVSNALIVVLITAIFGFYIIKTQWKFLLSQFSLQFKRQSTPIKNLLYDGLFLVAGICLVLPGWITDIFGLLLLPPFFRSFCSRLLKAFFLKKLNLNRIHIQTYTGMNEEGFNQTWMSYGLDLKNSWKKGKTSKKERKTFSSDSKAKEVQDKCKVFADVIELKSRKNLERQNNSTVLKNNRGPSLFDLSFSREESMVVLLGVPWDVTVSYGEGASLGPQALLKASSQIDLCDPDLGEIYKKGFFLESFSDTMMQKNCQTRPLARKVIQAWEKEPSLIFKEEFQSLLSQVNQACQDMVNWVYEKTRDIILEKKIPGLIGGDHSVSFGVIKALSEKKKEYGILQIDAHLDLRSSYQGFVHSHASLMDNVLSLSRPPQKIVSVGVRDFSFEEWERVQKDPCLVCFSDREIKRSLFQGESWNAMCQNILSSLPSRVYLSLDVDGLSPEHFPHTGTPVPGGLSFDQCLHLIMHVVKSGRQIIGFDLCELAPGKEGDWDANVGMRLLYQMASWTVKSWLLP